MSPSHLRGTKPKALAWSKHGSRRARDSVLRILGLECRSPLDPRVLGKWGGGDARHPGPSLAPVRTTLVRKRGVNCEEDVREVQGDTMSERHRVRREVDSTSIWRCLPQELPREALIPRTCGANGRPRGPGSRPDSRPFRGSGRTATR